MDRYDNIILFARTHAKEDPLRLLLRQDAYPDVDMRLVAQQIEGLQQSARKWPFLAACESIMYPPKLNREQSSSETTARHKTTLLPAGRLRIADLTGGMGVDSLILAQQAGSHVDYCEQDESLCALMEHNSKALGISNITINQGDSMTWLANWQEHFDVLYIDPARRGVHGAKVCAFEECTPNILEHKKMLMERGSMLIVKASPMIDLQLGCAQLEHVAAVHIVAVEGECKEVLFICQADATGEPTIHCVDLPDTKTFSFLRSEETVAEGLYSDHVGRWLYKPHAALMKGAPYKLLSQRYGVAMLGRNTHLYTSDSAVEDFPGRRFRVLQPLKLNKKAAAAALPEKKAHVVTANYPVDAAALQKQLGLSEGGDLFVIAATVGSIRGGWLCEKA
ncbi:MAG: class I SAM-dependent methyltransferase [Bacteroidales bacterium]|nr:class I SAM-dependent methyltransferase [Bacteroidales bacterium]